MNDETDQAGARKLSRRRFLGVAGAGAAALTGLTEASEASAAPPQVPVRPDHFSRMFRLPTFAESGPKLQAALLEIGRAGGPLDAADPLERGPVALIADPALSANNPNNPTHTAGTTFLGQFVDHDITFDAVSRLGVPTSPRKTPNSRSPALDLESVYGRGPAIDAQLYDSDDPILFRVASGGLFEDLPRVAARRAVIADPRNDENLIIAGLHLAFLRFHNRAVADLRAAGVTNLSDTFSQARRLTTWHYQWIVVNELLPQLIGADRVRDILRRGRRFYTQKVSSMPVEFQGAAYRFGHSMVRPSYRANLAGDQGQPFFAVIFDPAQLGQPDPADLSGGLRAPRRFIGWQTFFDFGDGQVRPNKLIDTKISTPLFHLPLATIPGLPGGPTSLAQRNLLRGVTWRLPSGQRVARHMGFPPLGPGNFPELRGFGLGLERSTPLWYYLLREAERIEGGLRLGPVGATIVGEVLIGLLQNDRRSYLNARPRWRPTLSARAGNGDFRMVDFLTYAGVDPISRGQ